MAYKFQHRILQKLKARRAISLILPMGAGKTRIAILWAQYKPSGARLVVCPSAAVPVWESELMKWGGHYAVSLAGLSRYQKVAKIQNLSPNTVWYIITYESFRSIANYMLGAKTPPVVTILDESHAIQSPRAQVTRAVHTWLINTRFKAILTGTPIGNSELNIWTQIYFLDKGAALGRSFYQFRYNHFEPDEMGWNWTIKKRSKVLINDTLQRYGAIMAENEIDLPPQTYSVVYVDKTDVQEKHLSTLMDEFSVYFDDGTAAFETKWVVAQLAKMRQICSGFMKTQSGTWMNIISEKYDRLIDLLENELDGHKVVIWCTFRREIKKVAYILKQKAIGYVTYHGNTSMDERKSNVHEFQTNKRIRCFIGQVATGGQAITLTAADRVVYMSSPYSVRQRAQSEKRTHRIGSEIHNRIHYTDIITRGTIEDHILKTLSEKQIQNDSIIYRHLIMRMLGRVRKNLDT